MHENNKHPAIKKKKCKTKLKSSLDNIDHNTTLQQHMYRIENNTIMSLVITY
jgi:hypothetical protein